MSPPSGKQNRNKRSPRSARPSRQDDDEAAPPRRRLDPDTARTITSALCVVLIALGAYWRFMNLAFPPHFTFDEHHFVENARNYINHVADWNDHPPLGKLVLIPGMLAFGDNGTGWRISSAVFGLACVGLAFLVARSLFRGDRRAGLFAATFVAADGFFISYSRTALLDAPLLAFVLAAFYLMLEGRSLVWFAGAAVAVGLAAAVKWTGGCILLVAPLLLVRRQRSAAHMIWMGAIAGVVYAAIWAIGLGITHQPIGLGAIWSKNWELLHHHAGFTVWDNAAASRWYTWPFLIHPVLLRHEEIGNGRVRAMSTVGNPVLWYATTAILFMAAVHAVKAGWAYARRREPIDAWASRAGLVLATMFALIVQFVLTERESYLWHYLGSYAVGLAFVAGVLVDHERKRPDHVLALMAVVGLASLYFYPVWTDAPLSIEALRSRLIFPGWR